MSSTTVMTKACCSYKRSFIYIQRLSYCPINLSQRPYAKYLSKSIRSAHNSSKTKPSSKITSPPKLNAIKNELPQAFIIGSIAGTLGSLVGMGGGFVMIPMMTSRLGISQHVAHGTSLFAVAATGVAGSLAYSQSDCVDVIGAIAITTGAIFSARLGANTTTKLSEQSLKRALGFFMICVAPLVPAKTYIDQRKKKTKARVDYTEENKIDTKKLLTCSSIGLTSGFLAGLFGVGGGAVVVPALTLLTDMDHYTALGTSLCAMTMPAIVGTVTHAQRGNVNLRIAPILAIGSFAGAYMGGKAGAEVEEDKLRWGFSGLMLSLGLKTLFRA